MTAQPNIIISEEDARRLGDLVASVSSSDVEASDLLDAELARATTVPVDALPANVVTMNSQVVFEDLDTHQKRDVMLVYPENADINAGRISVLTRMGSGLIGLAVGQEITWPMPRGRERRVRILAVHQPEATDGTPLAGASSQPAAASGQ